MRMPFNVPYARSAELFAAFGELFHKRRITEIPCFQGKREYWPP
jgi:hypothetical protein